MRAPRMQLIASMGLGKSGAILLHALALARHIDRWPGLFICAPLQVAYNWRNEIPLWIPGLRVEIIAGEEAERKAILQRGADITICTYDHLPWLDKYTAGHSWSAFGQMCACDESTKIKETRVAMMVSSTGKPFRKYNGGVQTNALARHAEDFGYWVNATGTPTPNGLQDVFGQYWYLDGGHRLGPSYTRFEQAYFAIPNRHTEFAKPMPIPGAMETISRLTADITVVARVEDYYPDLAKPNIVDKFIELPAKARKVYDSMKAQMAAELAEDKTVTVQTAGAKQTKLLQIACILKGTPVLTRRGWVPIESITATDKVWDGAEWVPTGGAVLKGHKAVVDMFGVRMTADHKVLTTWGWMPAQEITDGKIASGLNRKKVQLPDGISSLRQYAFRVRDVGVRVRLRGFRNAAKPSLAFDCNDAEERGALRVQMGGVECQASTYRHTALPYLVEHEAAVQQPKGQRLPPIWWGGHNRLRTVVVVIRALLGGHASWVCRCAHTGPDRWFGGVQPRQLSVVHHAGATEQSEGQSLAGYSEGAYDSITSRESLRCESGDTVRPDGSAGYDGRASVDNTAETYPVYDLLNCGPRERFVVDGWQGPLIVHNCGFAYWRDEDEDPDLQLCEELHTAKFDAIDSILNETGENLVVVYFYKATLQQLKKKYKKRLVELDKNGKAQDDWNAGKINILAMQYSAGSLGLSLQHGGRNICLLTPTYRADDYAQILERLGPLRQMQSGYNRVVNVFRILAHKTEDARVFDVPLGKITAEQAMVSFMQELTQ